MSATPLAWIGTLAYVGSWLIAIAALFIVPRNRRPGSATAWLMLIALLPYVGLVLFWLIGSPKLSRRRRELQRGMDARISAAVEHALEDPSLRQVFDPTLTERLRSVGALVSRLGGLPVCAGNTVELLPDYEGAIARMTEAVNSARRFVHVEFYIIATDHTTETFLDALEQAVRRGVAVRVLADHVGSRNYPGRRSLVRRLAAAGVDFHWTLPVRPFSGHWNRPDLRNHRKIVVADGEVGFIGSMNMIDRTYLLARNLRRGLYYEELSARVTGPVVAELDAAFTTDWYSETGELLAPREPPSPEPAPRSALCQVLPSGSGYDDYNNLRMFVELIHAARERLVLTSPYFVPDEALMVAITNAAERGVEVTLYSSAIADKFLVYHAQRSYYEELLAAGVAIRLIRQPALLHSKHMSVDGDVAVIGSSNLDMRSLTLNLEITLLCYDAGVVTALRSIEAGYRLRSDPLELTAWRARPLPSQLFDNLARLTAALE